MFAVGFLLWAGFALFPDGGGLREAWDRDLYWQAGVPLLVIVQAALAIASPERPVTQPLWALAGHLAGIFIVHEPGTGFGLLPLSLAFVGIPLYVVLLCAVLAGRAARRLRTPAD